MFDTEVFSSLNLCCVIMTLGIAQWVESRTKKIPNWLTVSSLIVGVALGVHDGLFSAHLGGFLLAFVIGVAHFLLKSVPGGMVKLTFGVGAMIGPSSPIGTYVVTAMMISWYRYQDAKTKVPLDVPLQPDVPKRTVQGSLIVTLGSILGAAALIGLKRLN